MFCYDEMRHLMLADNVEAIEHVIARLEEKLAAHPTSEDLATSIRDVADDRNLRHLGAVLLNTRKILERGRQSSRTRGRLERGPEESPAQPDLAITPWAD